MTERELNERYIRDNIEGICQDCIYLEKIVPIIRKITSEYYRDGLHQGWFDKEMDRFELQQKVVLLNETNSENYNKYCELLKENQKLKEQLNKNAESGKNIQ